MKTVRRKLIDSTGRDFATGQIVEIAKGPSESYAKNLAASKKRFDEKEVVNGKIHVEGLGRVKAPTK